MNEHENAGADAAPRTEEAEIPTKPRDRGGARGHQAHPVRRRGSPGAARRPRQPGRDRSRPCVEASDRVPASAASAGWANDRCRTSTTSTRTRASHGRSRSACGRSTSRRSPGPRSVAGHSAAATSCRSSRRGPRTGRPAGSACARPRTSSPSCRRSTSFKFGDRYWVVDGHNRVALALYGGQVAIDANVIELVPLGERRTEPISSLAPSVAASRAVRAAGSGHRPSLELSREDATTTEPPDAGADG